ncbi:MAG: hypothetical protein ABI539_05835 [Acidobacteriota bacterium]
MAKVRQFIKYSILLVLAFLTIQATVAAQSPQMRRIQDRLRRSAEAERERARRRTMENDPSIPKPPKAAVMNVDVRIAVTTVEYPTFSEAEQNRVEKIADGDTVWLYAKFNGKAGDYTHNIVDADNPGRVRHLLYFEVGPQGDVTTISRYVIELTKQELESPELKINLSPGSMWQKRSLPVLLVAASKGRPGLWTDEVRLTNTIVVPRGQNENLAKTDLVLDLAGGADKYRLIAENYDSVWLRGTTDPRMLPIGGTLNSDPIRKLITAKLRTEGIQPTRLYFAGDSWTEYATFTPSARRGRTAHAVFTYKKLQKCYYGVARADETFDQMSGKFKDTAITLTKDYSVACAP